MNFCTKTDKVMNGKAPVIEFYRYVFMVVLLAFHGRTNYFPNGYLVVEFFFILSGYLLMESYLRKPKTAVQYTVDKLKRTYVEYFVAVCFCFLYFGLLANLIRHTLSMDLIFKFIYEALLLQNIGIYDGGYNYPMWYFCVLIWGGAFLYYLISRYTELATHLFIPAISLMTLTFLYNHGDLPKIWETYNVFYIPFVRGIAEMGVGIILCMFAHSHYNKVHSSVWLDVFAVIAFGLILYVFYFNAEREYNKYVFLIFPLIIFAGMRNKGFLNIIFRSPIWRKLGGITYEMYLLHGILGSITNRAIEWVGIHWSLYLFIVYIIFVTLVAFIFKAGCQKLQSKFFL